MSKTAHASRRLLLAVVVIFGVTLITFVLARVLPQNVAQVWAGFQGFKASPEAIRDDETWRHIPLPGQTSFLPESHSQHPIALITIPVPAVGDPRLHHADVVVLAAIASLAGDRPRCDLTDEQISQRTVNISAKTVGRALERLAIGGPDGRVLGLPWRGAWQGDIPGDVGPGRRS